MGFRLFYFVFEMMGLTGVKDGEHSVAEEVEAESSSTIIFSFFFCVCASRTVTYVVLLDVCRFYSTYTTKVHIHLPLLRVKLWCPSDFVCIVA